MSKIRYIRKSDYEYIAKAQINYGTFVSDYADILTKILINFNSFLSSTLIVETDNGEIIGFDINILKPYSFWKEFYKNLSFFKKIKWLYSNKIQHDIINKYDDEFKDIYDDLYKIDDKVAYTFLYMFDKKIENNIRAADVGIMQLKLIADKYEYQTAEIKNSNIASIKSYTRRGFNTTKYFEYEKGVLFSVIKIDDIRDSIKNYNINCDIDLGVK